MTATVDFEQKYMSIKNNHFRVTEYFSICICNGTISSCDYLKQLIIQYKLHNDSLDDDTDSIVIVMNCFNHLLIHHDKNDNDFYFIYKSLYHDCQLNLCKPFQRYYCRNVIDKKLKFDKIDDKLLLLQQIFDQIHCHYRHQYDTGLRIRSMHYAINNNDHDEKNEQHIANKKRYKLQNYSNKFVSNLNRIKISTHNNDHITHDNTKQNKDITTYSYSYPFNYWDHCKDLKELSYNDLTYQDLHINKKYKNLKVELLNHAKDFEMNRPNYYLTTLLRDKIQTESARRLSAKCDKYWTEISHYPDHTSTYGYHENEAIRESNLSTIIIYCTENKFQENFSKTYREMEKNEPLNSIKNRHENYYHFAKILRETVDIYGVAYMDGNMRRIYHGIVGEMILNGIQCKIFGPLSTTSNILVAERFSVSGLILELVPDPHLKYFDCCPYSLYPYESEYLFVGGMALMNIMNITNTNTRQEFSNYIQPLRIIDTMTNGVYYDKDPTNIHKMRNKETDEWIVDIDELQKKFNIKWTTNDELEFTDISSSIKQVTLKLMQYRMSKSNKANQKYFIKLLNKICNEKKSIAINWESMNNDILDQVDDCGGYIGYKFLQCMICVKKNEIYERIDINKIYQLFPSTINIIIFNLPFIGDDYLNDILEFIQNEKESKITWFELALDTKVLDCCNISLLCKKYENKFKNIQYAIWIEQDKELKTSKVVIKLSF